MPKPKNPKLGIHLDLLRPQSNPEKIFTKLLRWLLSSGRFIFILVEAIVLIAFIARFKLDADLASNKELIDEQTPYINTQRSFENLVRETQLKLSTINSFKSNYVDYTKLMNDITSQIPSGIKLTSLNFDRTVSKVNIQLSAIAQSNNDLSSLVTGLKQNPIFSEVNVSNINFDRGILNFTITAKANLSEEGKNL